MIQNMIECKNLIYKYDKQNEDSKIAVNGVNLDIKKGEFLVVLGHIG